MRSWVVIAGCLLGVVPVARAQQPAAAPVPPAQVRAALVVEAPEPPRAELMNAVRGHLGQRGVFVLDEVATAAGRARVTGGQPRVLNDADIGNLRLALEVPLVVVVSVTPGTPAASVSVILGRGDGLFKHQTTGTAQDIASRTIAELAQLPMDAGPAAQAQPVAQAPATTSSPALRTGSSGFFMPMYGSVSIAPDQGDSTSESGYGLTFGAGSWFNEHLGFGAGGNIMWVQPSDYVDVLNWGAGADLFLRLNKQLMAAVYAGYGRVDFIVDEAVGSSTHETGMQLGLAAFFRLAGPFGVGATWYRTSIDGGSVSTYGIGVAIAN